MCVQAQDTWLLLKPDHLLVISEVLKGMLLIILKFLCTFDCNFDFGAAECSFSVRTLYVKYIVEIPLFSPLTSTSTGPQDVFLGSTGPISHTTLDKLTAERKRSDSIFQTQLIIFCQNQICC